MDKTVALFLLKIFSLAWDKYFAPVATAAINTAVAGRLATLTSAVLAGNLPDVSWAKGLKYLKLPDGSVVIADLNLRREWTAVEWAAEFKARKDNLAGLQSQLDFMPKPKVTPDQETLDFYNSHIGMMFGSTGLDEQINRIQVELAEMKVV